MDNERCKYNASFEIRSATSNNALSFIALYTLEKSCMLWVAPVLPDLEMAGRPLLRTFKATFYRARLVHIREEYKATPKATLERTVRPIIPVMWWDWMLSVGARHNIVPLPIPTCRTSRLLPVLQMCMFGGRTSVLDNNPLTSPLGHLPP